MLTASNRFARENCGVLHFDNPLNSVERLPVSFADVGERNPLQQLMKPLPNLSRMLAPIILSFSAAGSLSAATLITNGDFEDWPGTGAPPGWNAMSTVETSKVSGLGGGNAVELGLPTTGASAEAHLQSVLTTTVSAGSSFTFSMDFLQDAVTTGSSTTADRGTNVTLRQGGTTVLNFAVIGSVLKSTNGTSFGTISGSPTLTEDNWYRLVVTGSLGTGGTYSVSLLDLTSGSSTPLFTAENQTRWQTSPDETLTIDSVRLERGRSFTDWTADNVSLIPEPSSTLLLGLGFLGLTAVRRRN